MSNGASKQRLFEHVGYPDIWLEDPPFVVVLIEKGEEKNRYGFCDATREKLLEWLQERAGDWTGRGFMHPDRAQVAFRIETHRGHCYFVWDNRKHQFEERKHL